MKIWEQLFAANYLFITVFSFLSLSKDFFFSLALLSTHVLNKRTEVLAVFSDTETHAFNSLSIALFLFFKQMRCRCKALQASLTRNCSVHLNFHIRLVSVWRKILNYSGFKAFLKIFFLSLPKNSGRWKWRATRGTNQYGRKLSSWTDIFQLACSDSYTLTVVNV